MSRRKHAHELIDIRKTNDRTDRKRQRRAHYRARTQPTRDRCRLLALLTGTGVLR